MKLEMSKREVENKNLRSSRKSCFWEYNQKRKADEIEDFPHFFPSWFALIQAIKIIYGLLTL
jgi:hypothetical protein